MQTWEQREKILDQTSSYKGLVEQLCRSSGDTRRVERELSNEHARSVYDIVLCVYERFRVDGLKRYVNDDRFRVDGDKNMRLLAFAFTIVFVWTGPNIIMFSILIREMKDEKYLTIIEMFFVAD